MTSSEFSVAQPWQSNTKNAGRWIFSNVRHYWPIIAVILAGAIGNAGLAAAIPIFTGAAFDAVTGATPDLRALAVACLALVLSQGVRSTLQLGRNFGSEVLGQRLERDSRRELYGELLGKSMGFHDMHATGDVMARATNDVRELALMMAPGLNLVIGSAIFLVMPILVSPRYHPTLIIVPVLFAIGYALSMWHYLRSLQPVTAAVRHAFGEMNARLTEAVEGVETVKGAAQEDREVAIFEHNARRVRDAIVAQARVEARFLPLLLLAVATGVAFGQALYLYNAGAITIGAVAAYIGLISLFDFPVFTSLFAYSQVASGLSSARRILELIRAHAVVDQNMAGHAAPMRGGVRFDRVSFRYALGAPDEEAARSALDDISFTLEPGQTLALVGQTGAGKSSIAKLINRIYDVDSGGITIDGVDVRQWNLETLRRQISIIEQDIFLFSRSIAENIAFGKPQATRAEIEQAARAAQAHDFIMSFPDEYETVVGERGMTLSGGQRQRIALARAFLTDPAILILDDSTSAIDSATEDQIQQAIERATEGRTTILITHRLSQIRWADQIVVLRKGSVAAQGSHAELIERSQPYRDIFARL
ncbi:ABC transporter ATP-binding protein [Caldilinea sp.]|uniref:ABC transporter ATP-binding protein n=1 Tax=Caldilinea sp. TaxID=2293560 RepID=UPI002C1B0026|nr:ABC transporter ATP-binding protein [Caldilinea sp.]